MFSVTDDVAPPASAPALAVTPLAPYMLGTSVVSWVVYVALTTPLPPSITTFAAVEIGFSGVKDASPAVEVLSSGPPAKSDAVTATNTLAWLLVSIVGRGGRGGAVGVAVIIFRLMA